MAWRRRLTKIIRFRSSRRGSNKSEKGVESDVPEASESTAKDRQRKCQPEKSTLKSSILGSSSFCCAAGQKEDYEKLPSSRPIKKKLPKNAPSKRSSDKPGHDAPSVNVPKKTQLSRCRQTKIDNDTCEDKCNKEIVKQVSGDVPPPTKPRGLTHPAPPIHDRRPSPRINNCPGRHLDGGKKPNPELARNDTRASPETERDSGKQKYTEVIRKLSKDPAECTSNNLTSLNVQSDKLYEKVVTGQTMTSEDLKVDMMTKSCGTEDLDCPCCDSEMDSDPVRTVTDSGVLLSISENKNPSIADGKLCPDRLKVMSEGHQENDLNPDINKEQNVDIEVKALREELECEKLSFRKQQLHILELEKEVEVMEQLKTELTKEKELRMEAEQKLEEIRADDKRRMKDGCEIKAAFCTCAEDLSCVKLDVDEKSSQLLLGYESRIRRYQTYITKLEKDNVMLVNELKNFHDLSPCSQEKQAQSLLVKLGQLERDNQQQQKEYENCLDEVANKLVHTLLMQKRLEEECKLLHLKVDQLELENSELLKIIKTTEKYEEDDVGHTVFQNSATSKSLPSTPLSNESKEMSANGLFSRSVDETVSESTQRSRVSGSKTASTKTEIINGDVSLSDKTNVGSKIPAFNCNSPKSTPSRKRTKSESTHNAIENKNTRFSEVSVPVQIDVPPTSKISSPSETTSTDTTVHRIAKQRLSLSDSPTKLPFVKRKRSTKSIFNEKSSKDSKMRSASRRQQRISDTQQTHESSTKISLLPDTTTTDMNNVSTPESPAIVQEVWNFNCTVENDAQHVISEVINSVKWKLDSDNVSACPFNEKLEEMDDMIDKLSSSLRETENSVSTDGTHRTKDEGYSTMSSDLQQDSAADTTVSEHEEPSTTYLAPGSRFVSDDSVTECLDGSMTSSSDSGFGPLQQIALSSQKHLSQNSSYKAEPSSVSTSTKNGNFATNTVISTVSTYLSDYSQKAIDVRPLNYPNVKPCDFYVQSTFRPSEPTTKYNVIHIRENIDGRPLFTLPGNTETCLAEAISSFKDTDAKDSQTSNRFSQASSASSDSRKSVIECVPNDDDAEITSKGPETDCRMIETAEKATLTEPEEELWREKALAHFIDESIWSLYSSESDTQFKYFPTDIKTEVCPLEDVAITCPSSDTSPNIVITGPEESPDSNCTDNNSSIENAYAQLNSELASLLSSTPFLFSRPDIPDFKMCTSGRDVKCTRRSSLERVASDSLLYQKDAVHELEDALKPGLKTTRHFALSKSNIPLFHHFSLSDIFSATISPPTISHNKMSPEILMNLEKTMLQNNYIWPLSVNASRSSSLCSVPSSNSCQVNSDETDDVDNIRHPSRKGSQDPDLNSASDVEYENLEHKDFVERWIQKEIAQKVDPGTSKPDEGEKLETVLPSVRKKDFHPFARSHTDSLVSDPPFARHIKNSPWNHREIINPYNHELFQTEVSPEFITEISCPDEVANLASPDDVENRTSPIVYPIIFTCENIEEDIEPSSGMNEIEADLQLLDADLKEFNGDFYRLCDVASSSLSLDRSHLPVILERFDQLETASMTSSASPSLYRHKLPSIQDEENLSENPREPRKCNDSSFPSKPTGRVKPTRPVTLTFCDKPKPMGFFRLQKKSLCQEAIDVEPSTLSKSNKSVHASSIKEPKKTKTRNKDDISPYRRNSESTILLKAAKEKISSNQKSVMRSNSEPCSKILCSYSSSKSSLPVNQNVVESSISNSQFKSNINANSIVFAKENPKLLPVRKSYNKLKNGVVSPEKMCRSGFPSPKDNGVISKRYQWRKDRKQNSKEGCGTAWVHLEANPSLSDPKTRASLLDSMADTLSSSGTSSEDEDDVPLVQSNSHLQRICREKRQRIKASRGEDFIAVSPRHRSSVINRHSLYFRFGDQEKEAISCFDFLQDIPTSASEPGSLETFNSNKKLIPPTELNTTAKRSECNNKERVNLVSPWASETKSRQCSSNNSFGTRLRVPILWNQPLCLNMSSSTLNSQDCEILDHVSLSDSCAESYSSTPDSFEEVS